MAKKEAGAQALAPVSKGKGEDKLWFKFWPSYCPKTIEIPKIPLDTILRDAAKKYPDAVAVSYYDNQITYKD
jgi:hypothetical protein